MTVKDYKDTCAAREVADKTAAKNGLGLVPITCQRRPEY